MSPLGVGPKSIEAKKQSRVRLAPDLSHDPLPDSSGGERSDQRGHVVRRRDRGDDGKRYAAGDVFVESLADLLGRAEQECVFDQVPGGGGSGASPVLVGPGLAHLLDLVSVAEPAEEVRVHRHSYVGGEHETGERLDLFAFTGDTEEAAEQFEVLVGTVDAFDHFGQSAQRQEVGEGAVGLVDREFQHLAPERGEHDRGIAGRCRFQFESGGGSLACQSHSQEVDGLLDLAQGFLERDLVPAGNHAVGGGTDTQHEAAGGGVGHRGGLLGQQGGTSLEDADNPGSEPDLRGPGGAEGEWGKTVRTTGFAGPEIGVSLGLGLLDERPVFGKRGARQGQGQSPSGSSHRARLHRGRGP